ncbi:MAG: glycosyltransferase [Bacilli bacterium]|nr:glycosyltransferase [Bacilli bacterium]MBN2876213.1 glycosyltransferase [Bacilli bacterium]
MFIAFLNPQGNFDKNDSFWTEHPDFGGQLVYVKEIAVALAELGHHIDIITRKFSDPKLNMFHEDFDVYPGVDRVRIVRIPCGPNGFLPKELLWEHLDEWTDNIIQFYQKQGFQPEFYTGHYGDGGLAAAIIKSKSRTPYSFTGHSLGAQKLEKLGANETNFTTLDEKYFFSKRIEAERTAMKYADIIFVSTKQEQTEQYNHILYRDITNDLQDCFQIAPPGANTTVFSSEEQPFDKQFTDKFTAITERDIEADRLSLPYIIAASRLDPKKNHLGLVKAYAGNKKLQQKANLAISLRGIENAFSDYSKSKPDELKILDQIMKIIHEYHLKGKVTFISINSQQELASFYRYMAKRNSLFTLTALYEPFGLAPIEAMSAGLPAVVTKYGGPSDVLREGQNRYGVLVDIFNEDDIARGLLEGLDNHDEFQRLGIQRVNEKYTWMATAKTYLEAIQTILLKPKDAANIEIPPYFKHPDQSILNSDFIRKHLKGMES